MPENGILPHFARDSVFRFFLFLKIFIFSILVFLWLGAIFLIIEKMG